MRTPHHRPFATRLWTLAALVGLAMMLLGNPAQAQVTAFKQAVAEAASGDEQIAAYYRTHDYQPLWTGEGDVFKARRAALMQALIGSNCTGCRAGAMMQTR